MQQYVQKNKLAVFVLLTSLLLGVFVRVWDLSGGKFLWTDEYRTILHFDKYVLATGPFLNFVYKIPMVIWERSQYVALCVTAFWGILSILMVFFIGRSLFNDKVGSYSALLLSLSAIHVKYSRSGFAAVFQTFLLLIAFFFLISYFKKEEIRYIVFSGLVLGLAFLVYVPSYAAITSYFLLLPVILRSRGFFLKRIFAVIALLGSIILMVIFLCEVIGRINTSSYFVELSRYKTETYRHASKTIGKFNFSAPFTTFKGIALYGGGVQLWLMIIGIFYCTIAWFFNKDRWLFLLLGFIYGSFFVLYVMSLFAFHTIYLRQIVYLIPFLCICFSYLIYHVELITCKSFVVTILAVFLFLSLPKCFQVIKEMYTLKPISSWLERQNISKDRILSALDFSEDSSGLAPINIPLKYPNNKIDWEKVKTLYRRKAIRYILIPGLLVPGQRYRPFIGNNDPVLEKIKPIKTWIHPYNITNKRIMRSRKFLANVQDIAIYDLKEIFK